jgi:nicotinate-nucleotide--dimethylbenzimidazole phosphoribosyltransferase
VSSAAAQERALRRQASLTKPEGSLGRLEALAVQLAFVQGAELPQSRPAACLLFASDHPVASLGVSAYPSAVTRAMLRNFVSGGAASAVACRHLGVSLTVIDVGVLGAEQTPGTHRDPVADAQEGDLLHTDAMSPEVFDAAVRAGRAAVDALSAEVKVLLLGEMGIGNSTLASAVAAATWGLDPALSTGRGTGLDAEGLQRKTALIRQSLARVGKVTPKEALRRLGGRELAALHGAAARAIERGLLVLVDGAIATAAVASLVLEAPAARAHLVFGHRSADLSHRAMLEGLGVEPLLDLGLRLGEATGALAALPLLDLACSLHAQMATFAQAAVPERA